MDTLLSLRIVNIPMWFREHNNKSDISTAVSVFLSQYLDRTFIEMFFAEHDLNEMAKPPWFFQPLHAYSIISICVSSSVASTGWSRIYQGGPHDSLFPYSVVQTSDGGYAMAVFANAVYIDNIGYMGHFTSQYELHIVKTRRLWKRSMESNIRPQ